MRREATQPLGTPFPRVAVRIHRRLLRQVVAHLPSADINETAVPSYTHGNPLIRWLFWRRLDIAVSLALLRATDRVLDFGTGSGILLPTLQERSAEVAATDLDISPARSLIDAMHLSTLLIAPEEFNAWSEAYAGRIDVVMALDVFEHLSESELPVVGAKLRSLLAPGGRMVISGPTETTMYKLGRFIAGFRNVYHYRSVFDIDAQLREDWVAEETRFLPVVPRAFLITRYAPRRP